MLLTPFTINIIFIEIHNIVVPFFPMHKYMVNLQLYVSVSVWA